MAPKRISAQAALETAAMDARLQQIIDLNIPVQRSTRAILVNSSEDQTQQRLAYWPQTIDPLKLGESITRSSACLLPSCMIVISFSSMINGSRREQVIRFWLANAEQMANGLSNLKPSNISSLTAVSIYRACRT